MMKIIILCLTLLTLVACQSAKKQTAVQSRGLITPPTIIKAPDLTNLPIQSCKNGETIITPATLKLNKQGEVTDVFGLTVKDKNLANQIITQFKKARYTPYLQQGTPIAKDLPIVIRLKCPNK